MPRGCWLRTNVKLRAEQVHQLDVRRLNVDHGYRGLVGLGGVQVDYRVEGDLFIIESSDQIVRLEKTPCNYGGNRWWFRCPCCDKRVALLYARDRQYLCRNCHDLPYTTQRIKKMERLMIKIFKIRDQLKASPDFSKPALLKPRGMHFTTFYRLKADERLASRELAAVFQKKLDLRG